MSVVCIIIYVICFAAGLGKDNDKDNDKFIKRMQVRVVQNFKV